MNRLPLLLVLLVAAPASAATYYVRTDGDDSSCNGTANASVAAAPGCAWLTIDHAADSISASGGDTVRVQPGTYAERVTPGRNGTAVTATHTFVADGSVTVCGWDLSSNEYLRIIGFTIDTNAGGCSMTNGCVVIAGANAYLEFWNNTFRDATYQGIRVGSGGTYGSSLIIGNDFSNLGIGNYSGTAVSTVGDNNLVAYNEVHSVDPDAFAMFGDNNRWIGNYIHDLLEQGAGHPDGWQTGSDDFGWANNLFESNYQIGSGVSPNEHVAQISHAQASRCSGVCGDMTGNVFRRNVWHNISSGTVGINQVDVGPITYTRYYNNTTAGASEYYANNRYEMAWYGTLVDHAYIVNNISYEGWGSGVDTAIGVYCLSHDNSCNLAGMAYVIDYNLAYDPDGAVTFAAPFSGQAHGQLNQDPAFVNYAADDFHLGSSSRAIGNAGPLTTTSGSGTGTTFSVQASGGGWFRGDNTNISQYGGNLVGGDTIMVGSDRAVIASISGDTITVADSITWTDGEAVCFGDDPAPDIGAYPYRPGGYVYTASYARSGDVVTVTPSDEGLVRMVVVFEDGIPVGVDSTSPYVVSGVGSGDLDVRVYPRYASATLHVTATAGTTPGDGGGDVGSDTGVVADVGPPLDAGAADLDDAGAADLDAGDLDAGSADTAGDEGPAKTLDGGCTCRASGSGSEPSFLLLALLALGMRRRVIPW